MTCYWRRPFAGFVGVGVFLAAASQAQAQTATHRLGQLELSVLGVSATIDPLAPVVPKNIASAVRVVVRNGDHELSAADLTRFLGAGVRAQAELSGPGLSGTITLPYLHVGEQLPADPLFLPLPALPISGDYALSNIRLVAQGKPVLDVNPSDVTLKVIEQVLVTSVKTRALTMDEIRDKGIVLDSDDYLGFEFTLGLAFESNKVEMKLPVVFDRSGVQVPLPPNTGQGVARDVARTPTIIPILLQLPGGEGPPQPMPRVVDPRTGESGPIQIPSLIVIPGNVGYLKQFFSAQLYVANGAPTGSNLIVRGITGKIGLPTDGSLSLPELSRDGQTITQPLTMPVVGVGADGQPGTDDDVAALNPAEQGQAEFLLRGEQEGFHTIEFDIAATLDGLPTGPVQVAGKAKGGVLVRNPYFDVSFTVPSVVRTDEVFPLYVTLTNTGKGAANDVNVQLDWQTISNVELVDPADGKTSIDSIAPGASQTVVYRLRSLTNGQVYATYLRFDTDGAKDDAPVTGRVRFRVGVGERGVALSPDTLTLPSSVENLPTDVVRAAMRVLGQAWSICNAAPGTLPSGVRGISQTVVVNKARALAEAGLRVSLGESAPAAVRDLLADFYGGESVDLGFDQLLRQTVAGRDLARALGAALAEPADQSGGPVAYERELARFAASGPDFLSFVAVGAGPVDVSLLDATGQQLASGRDSGETTASIPRSDLVGGVLVPLGPVASAPMLGFVSRPTSAGYTLSVSGPADVAVTYPRGDGSLARVMASTVGPAQIVVDLSRPDVALLRQTANGSASESELAPTETLVAEGPTLISANTIGPESFEGASPFGINAAVLFDRLVQTASANTLANYSIPANQVLWAQRQLSGRLVFLRTAVPEGTYVPTHVAVAGVADWRGALMANAEVPLGTRIDTPGAVVIGRVVNADGSPAGVDHIYYYNFLPKPEEEGQAREVGVDTIPVSASGDYEIRYVRQGGSGLWFRLVASDPTNGVAREVRGYVRMPGERIVLDLALIGRGSVTGVVSGPRAGGAVGPVGGAVVEVRSEVDTSVGANATTDGDGRYTVSGITVGSVTVRAKLGMGLGAGWGRIERAGTTATVNVLLDSAAAMTVSGTVWTLSSGQMTKTPNALVVLCLAVLNSCPALAYTYTDGNGAYAFADVPHGNFRVMASTADGIAYATGTGPAGSNITGINPVIEIKSKGTASGVVRYPDGTAAVGVAVGQDITSLAGAVLTADDGSFVLPGIEIGRTVGIGATTLDRLRTGSATAAIPIGRDSVDGITIRLSELGSVEFLVLDPVGNPVSGQQVRMDTGGLTWGSACIDPCGCTVQTTDSSGKVRFSNLALGKYEARAYRAVGSYTDFAKTLAITRGEGEVGVGVLRFPGAGTVSGTVIPPKDVIATGGKVALTSRVFVQDYATQFCGFKDLVSHRGYVDVVTNEFSFTDINVGPVSATVENPFFPPAGAKGVLARNGDTLHLDVPLINKTAGETSGTILLPDGVTPAGLGVEVSLEGALPKVSGRTDETGHYRIASVLPEGPYTLTAIDSVTGSVAQQSVLLRAGQEAQFDLRLLGRGTVRVAVQDANGQPAERATVVLRETHYPNREFNAVIQPNDQGVATVARVFEGTFAVQASDVYGRGGRTSGTLTAPDQTVDITVTLNATGTIRGHFIRPDGSDMVPVPYGIVTLRGANLVAEATTSSDPDTLGAFNFDYVPVGTYSVEAADPLTRRTGQFSPLVIPPEGGLIQHDVIAQGLGTVKGIVSRSYAGGAPKGEVGARVEIRSGSFTATTRTDADGAYEAAGIPEGNITVSAQITSTSGSAGILTGTGSGALVGDGTSVTINVALRDSTGACGFVKTAQNGVPGAPVRVQISVGGLGGYTQQTMTDSSGRYCFSIVPAGTAALDVTSFTDIDRAHVANAVIDPDQAQNGSVELAPVTLNGIGSISGVVHRGDGTPVTEMVYVQAAGSFAYGTQVLPAADGAYTIPQFLAGPVTARVYSRGDFTLTGTNAGTVPAGGALSSFDIVLEPNAQIAGHVLASAADPASGVPGATVVLTLGNNRGRLTVLSASEGAFRFHDVPVGQHAVLATGPDGVRTGGVPVNVATVDDGKILTPTIALEDNPVRVVGMAPDSGSAVAVATPVTITFSSPLSWASGITVMDGSRSVSLTATLSGDGQTVTLKPYGSGWPDGRSLSVVVSTSVTDIFGRHPGSQWTGMFRTVDLSPPSVVSTVPANNAVEVTDGTITVTYGEPLSTAGVASVKRAGQAVPTSVLPLDPASPNVARFHIDEPLVSDQTYYVGVNGAVDQSANLQTAASNFTFRTKDTVAPSISLAQPGAAWVATATPTIAVSYYDATAGIDVSTAKIWLDGNLLAITSRVSGASHTPPAPLTEGSHTVTAEVADLAVPRHLADLAAKTFGIDLTPPTAPTTSSIVADQVLSGSVPMSVSASDAMSGIDKIDILLEGQLFGTLTAPTACSDNPSAVCTVTGSFATQGRAEGPHTLTLRAVDRAGNSTVGQPIPITIDNNPGVIAGVVSGPVPGPLTEDVVVSFYNVSTTVSAGSNGEYQLTDVPLNIAYNLDATVNGQVRARIPSVKLTAAQPRLTNQDLTLIGVGTVSGVVTLGGQPKSGATVRLQYQAANGLTATLQTSTPANGRYSFANAPVGDVWVWASYGTSQSAQEKRSIATHGDTLTVDLTLSDSAVPLPATLYDGNALMWQVRADGSLYGNWMYVSSGNSPRLIITPSGTANAEIFTGVTCPSSGTCYAPTEEGKREIVLGQTAPIAGLSVTRKVYVPADGYFVRHVEQLTNSGSGPITVDVVQEAVLNDTPSWAAPTVVASSSGATDALAADDRWAVVDDANTNDPYASGGPASAFYPLATVFSGEGGLAPTEASLSGKTLRYRWGNVTVAPGQTVAFMLLLSAQADRDRGQAAAERLIQLPPEVLAGLSIEEASQVKNFVIPADLSSSLQRLPANDGTIQGRVLAGDGLTAIPSASVAFRSRSPYYGRRFVVSVGSCSGSSLTGCYGLNPVLTGNTWTLLPREGFDVTATATSGVFSTTSATATGDLTADRSYANSNPLDFVFDGLGVVTATVLKANGDPISGARVTLTRDGSGESQTINSSSTGLATFLLVPAGTYTLVATYRGGTQSGAIEMPETPADRASLHVGQSLTFPAFAQITANVASALPYTVIYVYRTDAAGTARAYVDSYMVATASGSHAFGDLPAGYYFVQAWYNTASSVNQSALVSLADGQQASVDFSLPALFSVAGNVRSRDGVSQSPATRPIVYAYAADGTGYYGYVWADAAGGFTLTNMPAWPIRLRTYQQLQEGSYGYLYYSAEVPLSLTGNVTGVTALLPWGSLATSAQRDLWQFTVGTAGPKTLTLITAPTAGNALDPMLEVYDGNGTPVASNDNISTTNHDARVSFTAAPGTYTAVVRSAAGTVGAYRLGGPSSADDYVFRPVDGGVVSGQVVDDTDAHSPIAGLTVRLARAGLPTQTAVTDAQGGYVLPLIPTAGDYTIEVVDAVGVLIATLNGAGGNDNLQIVVPAHGTASVTVRRDTVPIVGLAVTFTSNHAGALPADATRTVTTNASGVAAASLPYGQITASATQEGATVSSEGDLDGASLALPDIVFASSLTTITGRVANGDNVTPLPGATVTLSNGMATTAAPDGTYTLAGVTPGTYTVTASFVVPQVSRTVTGQQMSTVAGGSVSLNFQLGVPVITGKVTDPTAGPAGVAVTVQAFNQGTYVSISVQTGPDGSYTIYGRPSWDVDWTISLSAHATDNSSVWFSAGSLGAYTSTFTGTLTRNLQLPVSGVVYGTVRSPEGALLSGAVVHLGGYPDQQMSTNENGQYYFTHLSAQTVRVYAFDAGGIPGEALPGDVAIGTPLQRDISIGPSGLLNLSLLDVQSQAQAGPVTVQVPMMLAGSGTTWSRSYDLTSNGAAGVRTVRVPPGLFRAIFDDRATPPAAAEGVVTADQVQMVTLQVGSHLRLPQLLSGAAASYCIKGSDYGESCDGTESGDISGSYVESLWDTAPFLAGPELDGRSLIGLRSVGDNIRVRRDHYVPASGEFGRTITWIENTSSDAVAMVNFGTSLHSWSRWELAATSDGNSVYDTTDAFAVAMVDGAARALVTGNRLPDEGTASAYFNESSEGGGGLWVDRTLTLAPGERKGFLTFTILDPTGNVEDVVARARSLSVLSRADALFGLTAAERAQIVNFNVPATGSVSGTITNGVGVPGARVALLAADGGVVAQAEASSDTEAPGAYALTDVPVGTYDLVAYDPATYRPGRVPGVIVSEGGAITADVDLASTSVGAVLINAAGEFTGTPAPAGTVVRISAAGFSPFWRATVTLDGSGPATFLMAPVGVPLTFTFLSPAAGGTSTLTLSGAEPTPPLVTLPAVESAQFPIELPTSASGSYFVFSDGRVSRTADGSCTPFCGASGILNDSYFPYGNADNRGGKPSEREVVAGPYALNGISVHRDAYVPLDGAFVRSVDVIENPSTFARTVPYRLWRTVCSGPCTLVRTSADPPDVFDTNDDYYVMSVPDAAALAMVVAGPRGAQRPASEHLGCYGGQCGDQWDYWPTLQIPAHGKAIIVQFLVLRAAGEEAQALATAQAIVAGVTAGDDTYLTGLTADDRAQIVNFNVAVPTALSGTVLDTTGAPLKSQTVRLTSATGEVVDGMTDGSGHYSLTLASRGTYTAEVMDPSGFVLARQPVNVDGPKALNWAVATNVGSVHAIVVDGTTLVDNARVQLTDNAGTVIAEQTGSDVTFLGVPPGDLYQVWGFEPGTNRPGRVTDVSVMRGVVSGVAVTLVETGTVRIHAVRDDTGQGAGNLQIGGGIDEYWPGWSFSLTLDGNGNGSLYNVPPGHGTAYYSGQNENGWGDWVLAGGETIDVTVYVGAQRAWYPINLSGDDGFPYSAWHSGEAHGNMREDDCRPFCGPFVAVDGADYMWAASGLLAQSGREVVNGPRQLSGLTVRRRLFVPQAGGFVRSLDVVSNPTDSDITVNYNLSESLDAASGAWTIGTTSSGDSTFDRDDHYVLVSHEDPTMPQLAFVVSGPDASTAPDTVNWTADNPTSPQYVSTWQQLTVPAHKTIILMQFAIQRAHGDETAAEDQAKALMSLTDPHALDGLSADEIHAIVNFDVSHTATFPVQLTPSVGSYFAFGDGGVSPTVDYGCQPFCGTWSAVSGTWFESLSHGILLAPQREVAVGPRMLGGLEVTRRVYAPDDGRFTRFLDVIDNPTGTDLSVTFETEGDVQSRTGQGWVVAATSAPDESDTTIGPGDDWVVLAAAGTETVALVTSGPGAALRPYDLSPGFETDWAWLWPRWGGLVVPAHGRAIVMQFAVVRPEGAAASAVTQAKALAGLSDADALAGMTPTERSQVVNFAVGN
jgi:hypothetical protein